MFSYGFKFRSIAQLVWTKPCLMHQEIPGRWFDSHARVAGLILSREFVGGSQLMSLLLIFLSLSPSLSKNQ